VKEMEHIFENLFEKISASELLSFYKKDGQAVCTECGKKGMDEVVKIWLDDADCPEILCGECMVRFGEKIMAEFK